MKPFKFFSEDESIPVYGVQEIPFRPLRRRWVGSNTGVPRWIDIPTGLLFYTEMVASVDPIDNNQIPEVRVEVRSKSITVESYGPHNYQEFLDAHSNNYIWIYSVSTETAIYNEHNINDLPIGEPVLIRAHIETE